MYSRRALQVLLFVGVAGMALFIGYRTDSERGLIGAGVGALLGLLLAIVSHLLWRRAQQVDGHAFVSAVMLAVIVSFVALVAIVFLVQFLWPELVRPVALTAVAVYIVHRFTEAAHASRGTGVEGEPRGGRTAEGTDRLAAPAAGDGSGERWSGEKR